MNLRALRLVVGREIATRWILWPIVLVLAILLAIVPYLVAVENKLETADAVWSGAAIGSWVVAGIVGMSLFGSELAESPMTFYFTRPFTARDLYLGKLVGGVALALGARAIFTLVVAAASPDARLGDVGPNVIPATVAAVAVGMLVGIAVRSRSRWLALDIAAMLAVGFAIAAIVGHVTTLHDRFAGVDRRLGPIDTAALERLADRVSNIQLAMLLVVLVAATLAGLLGVSVGRADRARTHAVVSSTLWSIVVPALGIATAVAWRAV